MKKRTFVTLAGVCLLAPFAGAQALAVANSSFENPQADSTWNPSPDGPYEYWTDLSGGVPGWTGSGAAGIWAPNLGANTFTSLPDGNNAGWASDGLGNGNLSQVVSHSITAGETYTLTVAFGYRADLTATYGIGHDGYMSLESADNTVLAGTATSGLVPGGFQDFTVSYTAQSTDPFLGQNLKIVLGNELGSQANFDNVRLNAVPEPASMVCLGIPALAATLRRRRKAR